MLSNKPARYSHDPGDHYYYNNWSFNALGAIFTQLTGKGVLEATFTELAEHTGMQDVDLPIGHVRDEEDIDDLSKLNGFYQLESDKSRFPAYHMRLSTRDLAAYGQWMLDNLKGENIDLPADWVVLSSTAYSVTNRKYNLGYGLLWYVSGARQPGNFNSFYHTGLGAHLLGIYPNNDLVIVHRVNTEEPGFSRDYLVPRLVPLVHKAI